MQLNICNSVFILFLFWFVWKRAVSLLESICLYFNFSSIEVTEYPIFHANFSFFFIFQQIYWQNLTKPVTADIFYIKLTTHHPKLSKWIWGWCWPFWAFLLAAVSMWLCWSIWSSEWHGNFLPKIQDSKLEDFSNSFPISSIYTEWTPAPEISSHLDNSFLSHWRD